MITDYYTVNSQSFVNTFQTPTRILQVMMTDRQGNQ